MKLVEAVESYSCGGVLLFLFLFVFTAKALVFCQPLPSPAFSAVVNVRIEEQDYPPGGFGNCVRGQGPLPRAEIDCPPVKVTQARSRVYFDGNSRWRFDEDVNDNGDFYIRDETKHLMYIFMERPVMGVYYHEYEVGPASAAIPEVFGFDEWSLYDRENPCSGLSPLYCERIGTQRVGGSLCDKWRMVIEKGPNIEVTRTIWIDPATGITVKSELAQKGKNLRRRHVTVLLTSIARGPQERWLFDLVTNDGRIRRPERQSGTLAQSATPPKETEGYTFRTSANEVRVDASVRDSKNRLVPDLRKTDFRILEDGVERPIVDFSFDQLPLALALVIDRSRSMENSIAEIRRTAAGVLSGLKPEDKVALFSFDSSIGKLADLTTDRQAIAEAVGEIKPGATTDIISALWEATLYLKQNAPNMRRVVILISTTLLLLTRERKPVKSGPRRN